MPDPGPTTLEARAGRAFPLSDPSEVFAGEEAGIEEGRPVSESGFRVEGALDENTAFVALVALISGNSRVAVKRAGDGMRVESISRAMSRHDQ